MRHIFFRPTLWAVVFVCLLSATGRAETIRIKGLKAPVKVAMDTHGVWHIKGKNDLDVMRVQGYLVAKYRLFQMDVFRRSALGTRAELFGKSKLEDDWNAKKLLVELVAPKILAQMSKPALAVLQAYADGANAFITSPAAANLPEYKKLGLKPQPWRPTDTIAIGRAMSWALSGGMPEELMIGVLRNMLGPKKFDELAPTSNIDPVTITRQTTESPSLAGLSEEALLKLMDSDVFANTWQGLGEKVGSNNWVVSGARTQSGQPMLANDPHLGLDVPAIWVMVHLTSPNLNVAGVSFAGTPGVVIGHNDHLGWGVTTTGYDVTDAYVLKMNPTNNKQYKFGSEWREIKEIPVGLKYWENGKMLVEKKTLRLTHFGPIALERDSGVSMGKTVAFRWTGHDPSTEIETFFGMDYAKNLDEFKKALSHFKTGAQNFIYLDRKGNIFYHAHADVPLHKEGLVPYVPMDGSDPEQQWKGYIPYDELPKKENPPEGYVVTANNRPAPLDYKYYIGRFFDGGSRARRITDLVLATPKHTPETFMAAQMDNKVFMQEKFLPVFLKAMEGQPAAGNQAAALAQLKAWDGHTTVDSLGPFVFFKWLKHINKLALEDNVTGNLAARAYDHIEVIGDIIRRQIDGRLNTNWFDIKNTEKVETMDDIARMAFPLAVAECEKILGPDPAKWTWGRIHQLNMNHDLLPEYNRSNIPGPGAYGTVNNAGHGFMGERMDYGGGPSVRLVMTPGEKSGIRMWTTLPGSDIADWKSKDAVDQFPNWLAGNYFEFDSNPARADQTKDNKRVVDFKP